jgi:isocitrate dehydrogenase kinase/phosphatase
MKKGIIALVFTLITSPFFAQAVFDKFDGQDDVTSIIVNKKMFELMSKVKVDASDETQQYMNLIKAGQFESFTTSTEQRMI